MASSSAAAPSAYRRHQVCQTCLRASSSFVKKLRLGADPSEQAFNLEQCLTCSQKARTASQTQLPEEGTGDGAQPQLRPRRLFLKDASPCAPASSAADAAAGADGLDLNSSREGLEGDECPPVAPSSPAAVHALPVSRVPSRRLCMPAMRAPLHALADAQSPWMLSSLHRRRTLCPRSPHGARWPRWFRRHPAHQAVPVAASRATCSVRGRAAVARRRRARLRARRAWRRMGRPTARHTPGRRPTPTAGGARLSLAARHPRRRRRRPPMASKPFVEAASRPTPTWPPSPPACAASRWASARTRNACERSKPVGGRIQPVGADACAPLTSVGGCEVISDQATGQDCV